jgi:hypothetical protein
MESDAFGLLLTRKMILGKSTPKVPGHALVDHGSVSLLLLTRPDPAFGCSSLVVFSCLPFSMVHTQHVHAKTKTLP